MKKRVDTIETMNCIAYYRVSTGKQKQSGLGLEAQKEMVRTYIKARPGRELIAEYEEVESGRNSKRPVIHEALARCKKERGRLVIAKLDRLARDVHFISGLMKAEVEFTALDLPEASPVYIHIIAAIAEHEAKLISERIKAALAQSTKRLGGRRYLRDWDVKNRVEYLKDKNGKRIRWDPTKATAAGRAARTDNFKKRQGQLIVATKSLRKSGMTLQAIGAELVKLGHQAPRGGVWHPAQVARILA